MLTPDTLNKELIQLIRDRLPKGATVTNYLMDILPLGKEAVYRRYRGEVPFTLAEAVTISRKIGISLDQLTGVKSAGEALLDMKYMQGKPHLEIYSDTMDQYGNAFQVLSRKQPNELWDASNRIVLGLQFHYPALSRFHLFKWLYQQDARVDGNAMFSYEEVELTRQLRAKQQYLVEVSREFNRSVYIWDNRAFFSLVNDIRYFRDVQMISEEHIGQLKNEMLQLLSEVESLAKNGAFPNGNELQMYVCHINFETSCAYVQSGEEKLSLIKVYNLNSILSHDQRVFDNLKGWIQSLRKFSTLITQSAEMRRYKFFKEQKEMISKL